MATILPPPLDQWIDQNGNPLESGLIYTYIPGTTTAKATWQDADSSILNENPIPLDASGRATIYGSGLYRFVVRDSAGNLVYDAVTADTSSGGIANGGTSTGTPNAQIVNASGFSQQDGQALEFIAGFTNSGPLTVAPGGGSGIPVLSDTSAGPVPLTGGEVTTANAVLLLYEAARGAFHLVNPTPGSFSGATITNSTITLSAISTSTIVLKQASDPTPTDEGDLQWSTLFNNFKVGDGSGTQRFWAGPAPGAISGCTIANNVADATNDIDFAAGTVADSTNAFYLVAGALTKRLDATWAVGNNQGGLFTGAAANTTYYAFIILRPDTGVVDAGFDTSATAANRPASYTYYRRVGAFVRLGGTILSFEQDGKYFRLRVPVSNYDQTNPGTAAISVTLTVPVGISVLASAHGFIYASSAVGDTSVLVTALADPDTTPTILIKTIRWISPSGGGAGANGYMSVPTNTSGQVRYRLDVSGGTTRMQFNTIGWTDFTL